MVQGIKASNSIGDNIRALRNNKKMTQEQLSAQLQVNSCDMSRGTLAKIEAGIRHISIDELRCIKRVLNTTYDELLK